jgi:hypothetical protein
MGFETERLKFQIEHLKLQLRMATLESDQRMTLMQAKDVIIGAQAAQIQRMHDSFGPDVLKLSMKSPPLASEKDSEEVIKGMLAVKNFEKFGLEVKLPEMMRSLKTWFARPTHDEER